MYIEKKNITLTTDTYAYLGRTSEQEIVNTFKIQLKKYVDTIKFFSNIDFEKLSNDDFYSLICSIYNLSLTEEDYLKIISERNKKTYNRFIEIGTFMIFNSISSEGKGNNFSWWEQPYQIRYVIAVSEDDNLKQNETLKKDKIKQKLKDKSIVIIAEKAKSLDSNLNYKEELEKFPIISLNSNELYSGNICGNITKDENFPIIISILRERLTKDKIINDMKDYLIDLNEQINEILSKYNSQYPYRKIAELCKKWFNNSEERDVLKKLKKEYLIKST